MKTDFIRTCASRACAILWPFCLIVAGCSIVLINKDKKSKAADVNISIYYTYPGRNQFSSAEKFYKKEIRPSHFAQTKIELDNDQKIQISSMAESLDFFQMPDSFYHSHEASGSKFQSLRIAIDSIDKTVNWRGSIDSLQPVKFHIEELFLFIDSMVKSTDAYKALPKSEITSD